MVVEGNEIAEKVHTILPNASFSIDNDGQLIIYTNLKPVANSDGGVSTTWEENK